MPIFRWFRDPLEALAKTIQELASVQREAGPTLDRLEVLELSRAKFEAEVQGLLLEAKGKLKAASNAEARERHQRQAYESQLDFVAPDGEGGNGEGHPVLVDDAPAGETHEVHTLHMGVAPNDKAHAVRAKWRQLASEL